MYYSIYNSKLGKMYMLSNGKQLFRLYFENQKNGLPIPISFIKNDKIDIFIKTKKYLKNYFNGKIENFNSKLLQLEGTEFQKMVWNILLDINYGTTTTYKNIADKISIIKDKTKMSSQAVAHAISQNPIIIIIPCHRVIGTNGKIKGYSAGISKQKELLKLEKIIK